MVVEAPRELIVQSEILHRKRTAKMFQVKHIPHDFGVQLLAAM
jgi:hypothetical protein